ncbi:MAG: phage minor head protein [Sulfuricaulis sp.]|nr:phage minor head protein [Sulfuricaulis sp.]
MHEDVVVSLAGNALVDGVHVKEWPAGVHEISDALEEGFKALTDLGREDTPLHRAANFHEPKIEVAVRYAFAMGRRAVDRDALRAAGNPTAARRAMAGAAEAVRAALLDVLPSALRKALAAGGGAGAAALRKLRAAGGPGSGNFGHAGRPGEVGGSAAGISMSTLNSRFPVAGAVVDGREIPGFDDEFGPDIPNMSSISASLTDYEVLDGVREVKVSEFEDNGKPSFYLATEETQVQALAEEIKQSKTITPLIVVFDASPKGPYILEGGHRFDALKLIGATSFPALVVVDTEELALRAGEDLRSAKAPKKIGIFELQFDAENEAAAAWAAEHAAELADGLSATSEQAIKDAVERAMLEGDLRTLFDDVLKAVGDEARARLIARSEAMLAANEGQRQLWDQAQEKGLLDDTAIVAWIATSGACEQCTELDGKTRTLNGEYPLNGGAGPTLHPNCRCTEGIVG